MAERSARWGRRVVWLLVLAGLALAAWRVKVFLDRPPKVEVVVVERRDVDRILALTGRVRPREEVRVVSEVAGRIESLTVDEGDAVERGQQLARIDSERARTRAEQARAALSARQDELAQARREVERTASLARDGLVPEQDFERDRLAVERGEQLVLQDRERLNEVRLLLLDHTIESPLSGWVLQRPVDPGQVVGTDQLLYLLATEGGAEVEAEVDEQYLAELSTGMTALASPLSDPSQVFALELDYISRRIDPETGAAILRFRFLEQAPELPVGLSLDVNLSVATHDDVPTVPRGAVVGGLGAAGKSGGGNAAFVLTVDDGVAVRTPVEVIDWPAEQVVVRSGLSGGEQVVLDPVGIDPGSSVRTDDEP